MSAPLSTVVSVDGVPLSYLRAGAGPALVIVHGSIADHRQWEPVVELLADHATCFVHDRRGRGGSGDAADYSVDVEVGDIATMMELAGPGASLLGHSYGALCVLEYAARHPVDDGRVLLFEPPLPHDMPVPAEVLADYRRAIDAGDPDAALEAAMTRIIGLSPEEFEEVRHSPLWPQLCALAPTWTREFEVIDNLDRDLSRYRGLAVADVTLIRGGESAPDFGRAAQRLVTAVPGIRLVDVPGIDHEANLAAPQVLAETIRRLLRPPHRLGDER